MNKKTFWLIVAGLHFLFFSKQVFFQNSIIQDGKEYLLAAENMKNHSTLYAWHLKYGINEDWYTKRPILYPAILLVFKYLSFGSSFIFFFLTYLVQNCMSLLNLFIALKIAEKFRPNFSYKHALFFLLFSISQLVYSNFIMSEVWLQFCLIAMLYVATLQRHQKYLWFKLAVLVILAMSLKPVFMLGAFLLPIIYLIVQLNKIKFVQLLACLMPLLFFYGMLKVNEKRTGYAHYSSISNINLLHYNAYVTLMNQYGTQKADSIVDHIKAKASLKPSYKEEQEFIKQEGTQLLKDHLGTYTYLHARGIAFALLDPGRFDLTQFFGLVHKHNLIYETNQKNQWFKIAKTFLNPLGFALMLIGFFNLFRLFIGIRFLILPVVNWKLKLLILAVPIYILAMTGPIGTSRFFMPLVPFALLIFTLTFKNKRSV
jgi:hypothetical protein